MCDKLIIVNSYGKCASTAFYCTLKEIEPTAKIHHVHGLHLDSLGENSGLMSTGEKIVFEVISQLVEATHDAHADLYGNFKQKIIITGLRDPYAYVVSAFIENEKSYFADFDYTQPLDVQKKNIIACFSNNIEKYLHSQYDVKDFLGQKFAELLQNPLRWVHCNLIDLFALILPIEELSEHGYATIKIQDTTIIVYLFERLSDCAPKILSLVTGQQATLVRENISSAKQSAHLYKALLEEYIPPRRLLDMLYDNDIYMNLYEKPYFEGAESSVQVYTAKCKKKVLKILQISPATYSSSSVIGGGEKIVLYIDKALHVAANVLHTPIETALLTLNGIPFPVTSQSAYTVLTVPGETWNIASINLTELAEHIKKYDVIYINQSLTRVGACVAAVAQLCGKVVVGMDAGGGVYHKILQDASFKQLFTVFHAYSAFVENFLRNPHTDVQLIKGPVDTENYHYQNRTRDRFILSVGRILPHKGFETLLAAVPAHISVKIVGTVYDDEYYSFLQRVGKNKRVTFLTKLSDEEVKELFATAALYVHPSTHVDFRGGFHPKAELLGLAPLEALSMGCPTFVANTGALCELSDFEGCWIFNDSVELTNMITAFFSGSMLVPEEEKIHHNVSALYGLEQFGTNLLKLFMELHNENPCHI